MSFRFNAILAALSLLCAAHVAQAQTNNIYNTTDITYGTATCTGTSGGDFSVNANAAIAAACSAGGGIVLFPATPGATYCAVTHAIINSCSGVTLKGAGNGPGNPTSSTQIRWNVNTAPPTISAANPDGAVLRSGVTYAGGTGSGQQIYNAGITGISVECGFGGSWTTLNAAVGIELQEIAQSTVNVTARDCTRANIYWTTNAAPGSVAPNATGSQYNEAWLYSQNATGSTGIGILIDAALGERDVSKNHFHELYAPYCLADGVVLGYQDNNTFDDITGFSNNSCPGRGLVFATGGYQVNNSPVTAGAQFMGLIAPNGGGQSVLTVSSPTAQLPPLTPCTATSCWVITDTNVGTTIFPAVQPNTWIVGASPAICIPPSTPCTGTGGAGTYLLNGPPQSVSSLDSMLAIQAYYPAGYSPGGAIVFPLSGGMVPNNQDFINGAYTRNSVVQGAASGFAISPVSGNTGALNATTVSLTTNAVLNYSKTAIVQGLPFLNTATSPVTVPGLGIYGAVPPSGPMIASPTTTGVPLNSPVLSLNVGHINMANGITDTVPLGTTITIGSAPTASAVIGNYFIVYSTAMGGPSSGPYASLCMGNTSTLPWCIIAPPGGNSQSGLTASSGTVTFTDMVLMFAGTLVSGDSLIAFVSGELLGPNSAGCDVNNNNPPTFFELGSTGVTGCKATGPRYITNGGAQVYGTANIGGSAPTLPSYTVATLPLCNNHTNVDAMAVVTDQHSMPVYMAAPASGGTVVAKVLCTGVPGVWTLQ